MDRLADLAGTDKESTVNQSTRMTDAQPATTARRCLRVRGVVQGVGFRPFVFRLAHELQLFGSVGNDSEGVVIDVQGPTERLDDFERRLTHETPPAAKITHIHRRVLPVRSTTGFVILLSESTGRVAPVIPADIAICDECLAEMRDPNNRRYRYPFINCTNCGPRYTITKGVPYDRPLTSMKGFRMCEACDAEYHNPRDRRFHAQPNACSVCGPRVTLHDGRQFIATTDPFAIAQEAIRGGKIVALRSLGGFHLACDATNNEAVATLRQRKQRPHKPFAVMTPNLESARAFCEISDVEAALLVDPSRPIVLLKRKADAVLAKGIAPDTDRIGLMLPSTPIHYLLFESFAGPLVMTSGNLSDEPIAIGNDEALERLGQFADLFILHDRDILQRLDDSIHQIVGTIPRVVRRARGIVPNPIQLPVSLSTPILACGGELKNTVALGVRDEVVIGQHLGDLDNPLTMGNFESTIEHMKRLLGCSPTIIAHDLHPDYLSTRWAVSRSNVKCVAVQHHHAHLMSVMTENSMTEPCLGIILDGSGLGTDGSIWGGEVLYGNARSFDRLAWLDPAPMPGSEAAVRQPWRMALSYLLYAHGGEIAVLPENWPRDISEESIRIVCQQIQRGVNAPLTSSCGRLFDGVASLLGLCHQVSYAAQAAIRLETAASSLGPLTYSGAKNCVSQLGSIDTRALIREVWERVVRKESVASVARWFHIELAELFIGSTLAAKRKTNCNRVALSGGVFQNRLFFEYMHQRLNDLGFEVLSHRQVPTNDGGLALGQLMIAQAATETALQKDN